MQNDLSFPLQQIFTKQNPVKENTRIPKCILKSNPFFTHQITTLNGLGNPAWLSYGLNEKASSSHQEINGMNCNDKLLFFAKI